MDRVVPSTYYHRYTVVLISGLGLIAWKIWSVQSDVDRSLGKVGHSPYKRVIRVILESGTYSAAFKCTTFTHIGHFPDPPPLLCMTAALYCAHLLFLIIFDSVGSNLYFVFLPAVRLRSAKPPHAGSPRTSSADSESSLSLLQLSPVKIGRAHV